MSTASFRTQSATPLRHNDKRKIVEHYDFVSPYYHSLWGEHLHHGYWIRGDESKELAQLQLTEHLAELADVQTGSAVLDIGCGFGASSLRSEEHTSELQSPDHLVCRLLLEKKKQT